MMPRLMSDVAMAIGASLALSIVVKASVVLVVTFTIARFCRRSSASVRHLLFASAFGILLLLPVAAFFLPSIAIELTVAQPNEQQPLFLIPSEALLTPQSSSSRSGTVPLDSSGRALSVTNLLVAGWLMGVVVFLLPIATGLWQMRRFSRRGLRWRKGQELVESLAAEEGVGRRIEVLRHDDAPGPLTWGILRTVIVVPSNVEEWTDTAIERALVHELEHVRRADWMMQSVARTACALYWFHPLAWAAWRRLRLAAECACDDAVLQRSNAAEYADQLVSLAERQVNLAREPALAMARRGDLSARVLAVLDRRQRRGRSRPRAITVSVAMVASLVTVVSPLTVAIAQVAEAKPDAGPSFDLVSIRPNVSGDPSTTMLGFPRGRFVAINVTVREIIFALYGLEFQGRDRITGGPSWISSDRFDIQAIAEGAATPAERRLMARRLLADRFGLRVHTEMQERPVYALTLARTNGQFGPRFRASTADCPAAGGPSSPPTPPPPGALASSRPCGVSPAAPPGRVNGYGAEMWQLAGVLGPATGRVVMDRTGLTGRFDFDLDWTPQPSAAVDGAPSNDALSIFTAIQEQLGLRLEPRTEQIEVLVIDNAERPTAN
jgi:uncharacterized protein (TIGR03435 family)